MTKCHLFGVRQWNAGWLDIHNAMRKKIPESFSVRKYEHELSVKEVSVDPKSLQYVRVVLVRVLHDPS
jgi:hypothetical protein